MNKDITKIDDDEQADKAGVERFAAAMLKKLSLKRCEGRGGWNDPYTCTTWKLREMLIEHMRKGDVIDIANFCMMLWNRENPTAEAAHPEAVSRWVPVADGAKLIRANFAHEVSPCDMILAVDEAGNWYKLEGVPSSFPPQHDE